MKDEYITALSKSFGLSSLSLSFKKLMFLQSGSTLLLETSTYKGHQCAVTIIIFLIILFRKKGAKSSYSCLGFFLGSSKAEKVTFYTFKPKHRV